MLKVDGVSKRFGGIKALDNVSVELEKDTIVGLMGPNGSGKTTLFNIISGILKPDKGTIVFNNTKIDGLAPNKIATLGISRTFQEIRLINDLTVLENTMISALQHFKMDYNKAAEHSLKALETVGLEKKSEWFVRDLNLYEKKLIEMARAIAAMPKLILVDEIMAGLTEEEQSRVARIMNELREYGITIFWIEHVIRAMFKLLKVDKIIVLNWGKKLAEGSPEEILHNKEVIEAYLGKSSMRGG
uniref:ABC transporter ATP-binding protein n=1 Tax=Fervidobacterium pennivorans TaxID=93466 RepID=A0A7V4NEP1_FERPE